jgi:hypothetical protein
MSAARAQALELPYRGVYVPDDVADWIVHLRRPWGRVQERLLEHEGIEFAVGFRAAGVAGEAGSGNLPALAYPAGTATGDNVFALIGSADNVALGMPAGWTLKTGVNAGTTLRGSICYHHYTSGDATPVFTHVAGDAIRGVLLGFTGVVLSGDPFDGAPTTQANTATTTVTAPTITPGGGNASDALLLAAFEELNANTSGAPSIANFSGTVPTPAQVHNSHHSGLGANMMSLAASWGNKSDANASGARTAAVTGEAATPTNVLGISALLLPAASGRPVIQVIRQAIMRGATR